MTDEAEYYECPACCYATTAVNRWLAHGLTHAGPSCREQTEPTQPQLDWKEACIEACVVNHLGWDDSNPKKTLANLIQCEVKMALDPLISQEAIQLRDTHLDQLNEALGLLANIRDYCREREFIIGLDSLADQLDSYLEGKL